MNAKFFKKLTAIALVVLMVASALSALAIGTNAAGETYTWTRVTSVDTLIAGGDFIIGYEATANSGVIIPMANTGTATTSAAGLMYSGAAAASGDKTTLDMTTYSEDGAAFVVTIAESTVTSKNITICTEKGYIGNANTKNNCKLFSEDTKANGTSFTPTMGTNDVITLKNENSTYHTFQYNSSSPRFCCYNGGQKNLVIYQRTLQEAKHEHSYAWGGDVGADGSHTLTCANTDGKCDALTKTESCTWEDGSCSVCGAEAPECAHPDTTEVAEVPATCTEVGYTAGVQCTVCNAYTEGHEKIEALGHTEVTDEAVGATCTTTGLTAGSHCSVCDKVLVEQTIIDALGHNYVDGVCSECQEKQPKTLTINRDSFGKASGYGWHAWTATTTTGGSISGSGYIYGTETTSIQMNGSKEGDYIYNTTALPGKITSVKLTQASGTSRNFDVLTSDTPFDSATAASLKGQATDAKKVVTTEGVTWTFDTNHKYFAIVICDSSAAYLSSIEITYSVCSHANKEAIGEAKDATCTEDGITAGVKCSDCGEIITAQETIEALNHNFVDGFCTRCNKEECNHIDKGITLGEITKEASCTETGLQEQFCAQCGQPLEDKVLDKEAHTPVTDEAVAPTCTETGLTEGSHCSVCNETLAEQTVVDMIDHDYVNNKCTVCGDVIVTGDKLAEFQFGENGEAKHKDGSESSLQSSYTANNYTLTWDTHSKVYGNAYDAKGNSALKLGTIDKVGVFAFTVPENVKTVVIYISGRTTKDVDITVNGTSYTITTHSDDGKYTKIVVDTSTTKTVELTTTSNGYRAMVDSIEFWGEAVSTINGFGLTLNKGVTVNVSVDVSADWLAINPDAKIVFSTGTELAAVAGKNTYSITLTPLQIKEVLTVSLQKADGTEIISKDVSVQTYVDKIMADDMTAERLNIKEERFAKLKTLLAAVMNYGTAAENEAVEDNPAIPDVGTCTKVGDAFVGFGANLGGYTRVTILLDKKLLSNYTDATVSISLGGKTIVDSVPAADKIADGKIVIEGLSPANFDKEIVVTLGDSTLTFTFNQYLSYLALSDTSYAALATAAYNYGVAAAAYTA